MVFSIGHFSLLGQKKLQNSSMLIHRLLSIIFIIGAIAFVHAQPTNGTIKGRVFDSSNTPLSLANIVLKESSKGAVSDFDGHFQISNIKSGKYTIEVSVLGYETVSKRITVELGKITEVNFICSESTTQLEGVTVISEVQSQAGNRTYTPLVLNMKPIQATPQTTVQVINRLPGIRIRQQGGTGSDANIMLNGIGGKGVKVFYDGIPVDLLGAGFSINTISSSMIKRIEVYKGTIPVAFGSDALGGIINIVSNNEFKSELLDVSYTYGSWNTNKASFGAKKKLGKTDRFSISLDGYLNYSDNDYWMDDVNVIVDDNNNTVLGRARRFNDMFRAYFGRAQFEARDFAGADQVKLMFNYSDIFKQWQHGITADQPWGEPFSEENSWSTALSWKKYSDDNRWTVDLVAGYGYNNLEFIDVANKTYFWDNTTGGLNYVLKPSGGESGLFSNGTTPELKTESFFGRSNINFKVNETHTINFTSLTTKDEVKGRNKALSQDNQQRFSQPQELFKNYAGLALDSDFKDGLVGNTLYIKHFYSNSLGNRIVGYGELGDPIRTISSVVGYGDVLDYKFNETIRLNLGYEYTIRQPDGEEIFGDYITIQPNPELIPEKSHNINFGVEAKANKISAGANFFYRNTKDQIFLNSLTFGQAQYLNLLETKTTGVEANFSASLLKGLNASANATYQNTILDEVDPSSDIPTDLIGERIPNTPYFYGNAQLLYKTKSPFAKEADLSLSYGLNYIHGFLRSWDVARTQSGTPTQWIHNANVTWTAPKGRWSFSLECSNLTDAKAYDNFFVQRPGRSFFFKTRYFLNN